MFYHNVFIISFWKMKIFEQDDDDDDDDKKILKLMLQDDK